MITKMESERLLNLATDYGYAQKQGLELKATNIMITLVNYLNSIMEKPKVYYAVNWNWAGCLPDGDPYDGLETAEDIRYAIEDCIKDIVGDDDYEDELREHDLDMYETEIDTWIAGDTLEHETLFYIDNFAIFIYKEESNEPK
jgi:hypothetical protein